MFETVVDKVCRSLEVLTKSSLELSHYVLHCENCTAYVCHEGLPLQYDIDTKRKTGNQLGPVCPYQMEV